MKQSILVYHLKESKFEVSAYTFQGKVKANIYDDLEIDDFNKIALQYKKRCQVLETSS